MTAEDTSQTAPDAATSPEPAPRKPLTPEAERALAEAAERRRIAEEQQQQQQAKAEINGRGGLDPVRYGDWEIKGLTSDF